MRYQFEHKGNLYGYDFDISGLKNLLVVSSLEIEIPETLGKFYAVNENNGSALTNCKFYVS